MEDTTVTIHLDFDKADAQLDSLIAKAEHLSSLLADINNIDEEIETAERIAATPKIVFAVNVGDLGQILKTPDGVFKPEFVKQVSEILPVMLNKKEQVEEVVKKTIDLTQSNNYKKQQAEA